MQRHAGCRNDTFYEKYSFLLPSYPHVVLLLQSLESGGNFPAANEIADCSTLFETFAARILSFIPRFGFIEHCAMPPREAKPNSVLLRTAGKCWDHRRNV
jgi:hypothetical protein